MSGEVSVCVLGTRHCLTAAQKDEIHRPVWWGPWWPPPGSGRGWEITWVLFVVVRFRYYLFRKCTLGLNADRIVFGLFIIFIGIVDLVMWATSDKQTYMCMLFYSHSGRSQVSWFSRIGVRLISVLYLLFIVSWLILYCFLYMLFECTYCTIYAPTEARKPERLTEFPLCAPSPPPFLYLCPILLTIFYEWKGVSVAGSCSFARGAGTRTLRRTAQ